jgi:homoserine kinase
VSTEAARRVLPDTYERADAVRNVGWSTLLVAALCAGRADLLGTALQDCLHQPYRAPLIPGFDQAVAAAVAAGAFGACLSGSGSTMLALVPPDRAAAVGAAMAHAVQAAGCPARSLTLAVSEAGAAVTG